MSNTYKLHPSIQQYAWGGSEFIPNWLGIAGDQPPYAEAWYGAHPMHSSAIDVDGQSIKLVDYIHQFPLDTLGLESIDTYGPKLPFLLKILDVRNMLSIQLHPDKSGAEAGFADENKRGIPISAHNRNYKDDNHKPELLIALSDFWMLQGFEDLDKIKTRMNLLVPGFLDTYSGFNWQGLIGAIWDLGEEEKNRWCRMLCTNLSKINLQDKNELGYWLVKAIDTYPPIDGAYDRGILVMLLLHVQYLRPGQAGYQAPGVLHAYLEGQNIELMSNSDNVLRGGLTPKHIDVEEMMRHLNTTESGHCLLEAIYLMDDEIVFSTPVPDFLIKQYHIDAQTKKLIQFNTPSILLLKEGSLEYGHGQILSHGSSLFIPAYNILEINSITSNSTFFVATTSV